MHPIAFHVFGRPIYWYGILVAAGFLAALVHWSRFAARAGQPSDRGADLALWAMVGGMVGARLFFVLAHLDHYRSHPIEMLRIDRGGLVFYGGLIGGVAAVVLLARRRRTSLWPLGDFAVTALPLGHAFGRLGCFLNGCCYGHAAPVWAPAVNLEGALRHPVQLYEAGFNLLLYGGLWALWLRRTRPRPGLTLAVYLAGYGTGRFFLEFLRGDTPPVAAGLSGAQLLSLALIAVSPLVLRLARAQTAQRRSIASP